MENVARELEQKINKRKIILIIHKFCWNFFWVIISIFLGGKRAINKR